MLEIKNLYKNFDGVKAVQDFSLNVRSGKGDEPDRSKWCGENDGIQHRHRFSPAVERRCIVPRRKYHWQNTMENCPQGISRTFQNLRLFRKAHCLGECIVRKDKNNRGNSCFEHFSHSLRILLIIGRILKRRWNISRFSGARG